jgi:cytoskeletal protein CcmA (bactofilin family)
MTAKSNLAWSPDPHLGTALIEGMVKGDMHAGDVWLGKTASLTGNIFADQVAVEGEVRGLIYANQVRLGATSRVRGTIISHLLAIEPGADFEGKCRSLARLLQHRHSPQPWNAAALAAE